jgi:hypothetical protein
MNIEAIGILAVERDGDDGVIITFSDGTSAGFVVEELLELRPYRGQTEDTAHRPIVRRPGVALTQNAHTLHAVPRRT